MNKHTELIILDEITYFDKTVLEILEEPHSKSGKILSYSTSMNKYDMIYFITNKRRVIE